MKESQIHSYFGGFNVIDLLLGLQPMGIGLTLAWLFIGWIFVIFLKGVKAGITENHQRKTECFKTCWSMILILLSVLTLLHTIYSLVYM